jgi:hypothetical protein
MQEDYNGFYGTWFWDWDWVVYRDPDYLKYVTEGEIGWQGIPQPTRAIIREHEHLVQRMDNAFRHVDRSRYTDEDDAIIKMMRANAKAEEPVAQPIPVVMMNNDEPLPVPANDELLPAVDDEYQERRERLALEATEYRDREAHRHDYIRNRSKFRRKYTYGTDHVDVRYTTPPAPTTLLLPPPKSALLPTSVYRKSPQLTYKINSHMYLDDRSVVEVEGFSEDDERIRVYTYKFTLNKAYDSHKNRHDDKARVVFNKKTGNLYIIEYARDKEKSLKKGLHKPRIIGVSSQVGYLGIVLNKMNSGHVKDFVNAMYFATSKKINALPIVPIVEERDYTLNANAATIIALLWQHKVGMAIQWINRDVVATLAVLRSGLRLEYTTPEEKKDRAKRSFIKMMRKKTHPTTLFKHLLGDMFNGTVYRLVMSPYSTRHQNGIEVVHLIRLMSVNKSVHHFVAHVLSKTDGVFINKMLEAVNSTSNIFIGHSGKMTDVDDETQRLHDKYIRLLTAFCNTYGEKAEPVDWYTFRDTLRMAETYKISVNMSQLNSATAVHLLHNRLSGYTQRDDAAITSLECNTFMPFEHPTQEYSGYKFHHLDTVEQLVEEGRGMKHCVGGYGDQCLRGMSIIFSMRKDNVGYVTIEINGRDTSYRIVQKYTRHDVVITNKEILDLITQWQMDLVKMHAGDQTTYEVMCDWVKKYVATCKLIDSGQHPEEILNELTEERDALRMALQVNGALNYAELVMKTGHTVSYGHRYYHRPLGARGQVAAPAPVEVDIDDLRTRFEELTEALVNAQGREVNG